MTDPILPPNAPPPPVAPAPDAPPPPSKTNGNGCWKIGCGGCLVLLILLFGLGVWVSVTVRKSFNQPPFPPLVLTEQEEAELERKTIHFEALAAEERQLPAPSEGFLFTGRELTAWLERENPELADMVRISTEPDLLRVSVRVGETDIPGPRMAFEAAVQIVQVDDRMELSVREIRFGPFRVPRFIMRELEQEDFFKELFDDPETRKAFSDHVERFEIRSDGVWIMPRR